MNLNEYLSRTKIDRAVFADRIGVTRAALNLWLAGKRTPKPEMMRRIMAATEDSVTPNDFLQRIDEPEAAE